MHLSFLSKEAIEDFATFVAFVAAAGVMEGGGGSREFNFLSSGRKPHGWHRRPASEAVDDAGWAVSLLPPAGAAGGGGRQPLP